MFVNVVEFPPVVEGRDAEFREWFEWSNVVYAAFDGFVCRRLLEDIAAPGPYAAIVEHTFMAMHTSEARQQASKRIESLLTGSPRAAFDTVVSTADRSVPAV